MQALQEGLFQIKDKVLLETFLKWVWTSANFYEVPWLSFEPKVSKLPSAWYKNVSGTFLTAESFRISFDFLKVEDGLQVIYWLICQ